jgi:hypothetical protein
MNPSVFIATLDSRNFKFEGVGTSPDHAGDVLHAALVKHGQQFRLAPNWWMDKHDINVRELQIDAGYRDHEQLTNED